MPELRRRRDPMLAAFLRASAPGTPPLSALAILHLKQFHSVASTAIPALSSVVAFLVVDAAHAVQVRGDCEPFTNGACGMRRAEEFDLERAFAVGESR